MVIRPLVASVVGQSSDTRWGQVLQLPHAYGVIEVFAADGIARQRGVATLTKLSRRLEEPPVALAELEAVADGAYTPDIVSLVLIVPVGKVLYLVSRGEAQVYLKRGGQIAVLLSGDRALSGEVREGDTFIAATSSFGRTLTSEEVASVFDHLPPSEVAEKLTILLQMRQDGEGGAALIFQVAGLYSLETQDEEQPKIPSSEVSEKTPVTPGKLALAQTLALLRRHLTRVWERRQKPSARVLIAVVTLALFVISIVLGVRHQQKTKTRTQTAEVLTQAQHAFDEGMALLDLNPVKGRDRLREARDLLAPHAAQKARSEEVRRLQTLYQEVIANLGRAMQVYKAEPELFYDASLIKKGAVATDIALYDDTLGILDSAGSTVFTLLLSSKSGAVVGGGESFRGGSQIAVYGDKVYVVTPRGINAVRLSDKKTTTDIVPKSPEWGTIGDLVAYGGNLYLLDTGKSRIWKYVATEKGFSELREYLNPDTLPDFSSVTNMAIDGSVWLGTTAGKILRFTLGKENTYLPQGVAPPFGDNLMAATSDTVKHLYVLDQNNKRVVVLDKDGMYLAQYVWESEFKPSQIIVSEKLKKILLLAEGKIYSLELK